MKGNINKTYVHRDSTDGPARTRTGNLEIMSPLLNSVSSDDADTCDGNPGRLSIHLATILQNHPELASVVESWPTLPEPVRVGILAMVRSSQGPS